MSKISKTETDIYHEYQKLSTSVAVDYSFVQGGGGNVSIKSDRHLFVKASGTRLNEATNLVGFVILNRKVARECIRSGSSLEHAVVDGSPGGRPSIEAPLHVECGGKYVVHVHSVGAIAIGLLDEGFEFCAKEGWHCVEYVLPGEPLLSALKGSANFMRPEGTAVLSNHGLLVWDSSLEGCIKRVVLTEAKCRDYLSSRHLSQKVGGIILDVDSGNTEFLNFGSGLSGDWLQFITENVLLPDQAVFLAGVNLKDLIRNNNEIEIKSLAQDQKEMLKLLHLLGKFLRPEDCKRPLSALEVSVVLGLESEKYRQVKLR